MHGVCPNKADVSALRQPLLPAGQLLPPNEQSAGRKLRQPTLPHSWTVENMQADDGLPFRYPKEAALSTDRVLLGSCTTNSHICPPIRICKPVA